MVILKQGKEGRKRTVPRSPLNGDLEIK